MSETMAGNEAFMSESLVNLDTFYAQAFPDQNRVLSLLPAIFFRSRDYCCDLVVIWQAFLEFCGFVTVWRTVVAC